MEETKISIYSSFLWGLNWMENSRSVLMLRWLREPPANFSCKLSICRFLLPFKLMLLRKSHLWGTRRSLLLYINMFFLLGLEGHPNIYYPKNMNNVWFLPSIFQNWVIFVEREGSAVSNEMAAYSCTFKLVRLFCSTHLCDILYCNVMTENIWGGGLDKLTHK